MKNIDVKILFSKLKGVFRRTEFRSIGAKASHDWKIMAVTFFVFWIMIFAWSFFMFVEIDNGEVFKTTVENAQIGEPLNKKQIEDTVSVFEGKKIKLEELKKRLVSFPDPFK